MEKNIKYFAQFGFLFSICLVGIHYVSGIVSSIIASTLNSINIITIISNLFGPFSSFYMILLICLLLSSIALNKKSKANKPCTNCLKAVLIFTFLSTLVAISIGLQDFCSGIISLSVGTTGFGVTQLIFGIIGLGFGIWMAITLGVKGFKKEFTYVFGLEKKNDETDKIDDQDKI